MLNSTGNMTCSSGTYTDTLLKYCSRCDGSCADCSLSTYQNYQCRTCIAPYVLNSNNRCICPSIGAYTDQTSNCSKLDRSHYNNNNNAN